MTDKDEESGHTSIHNMNFKFSEIDKYLTPGLPGKKQEVVLVPLLSDYEIHAPKA